MISAILFFMLSAAAPLQMDSVRELDLSGWVAVALENSPDLKQAEASVLSARASLTGSRSFLWPSLTASAGASRSWSQTPVQGEGILDTESDNYSMGLTLSQELLQSGGQNWLYKNASELSLMAVEADYQGTVLEVTRNVVTAYYDVLEAIELGRSSIDAHERSLNQLQRTEALYEMGAITTLELLQIQVQESTDRLAVTRKEQRLNEAYSALYNSAGIPAGNGYGINPEAVLEPLQMESAGMIPLDLSANPTLRASELRTRASYLQADAAERAYWPSLRASAGWSWNDNTLDDIDRMFDSDGYSVGISLSWNIFDGFLRESRINSARAAVLNSDASLEGLRNDLESAVETLMNTLLTDIQYYHDSMLTLQLAEEKYRLSLMSYQMGALSLLDLLDAQSGLSQAEANLVSARVSALKSEAYLLVTLGRMPRIGE